MRAMRTIWQAIILAVLLAVLSSWPAQIQAQEPPGPIYVAAGSRS